MRSDLRQYDINVDLKQDWSYKSHVNIIFLTFFQRLELDLISTSFVVQKK